ncbi:DUF3347 domain-containing protein [Nubsella zeaxanthinifaciens]|uniref:DUF3347 domain-containing protein n=1 Tax=Nubsella zeaxanthinifaciens TaxID=392412 RepID=UPI000DE41252|nr:DUF3347 domain-containing protein [Nubsella zeaxanthinifaciens]
MKRYQVLGLLLLVFAACTNQKVEDKKEVPVKKQVVINTDAVLVKNDQLNAAYQQYLLLSDALVNSDMATAKEASMALELGAKAINGGSLIANLAAKITASANLEVQRSLFAQLSDEMIAKVRQTGLKSGEVYVEFCPMALNDKGAFWLSNQKQIKNPYYGESMLDCGEVKETLK